MKSTDTVRSVKEKIEALEGIPLAVQVLKSSAPETELADDQYLGDCGIIADSILNLTLQYAPGGEGTADDPYLISDEEQLEVFQYYINHMSADGGQGEYFKLTADIDLKNEPWTPIGNSEDKAFKGNFDGGGHAISGLYINEPSEDYQGLFGSIGEGSAVKNLSVSGSVTGGDYVGGIVGDSTDATIENCHSSVTVNGELRVGGIIGSGYRNTVTDCTNTGTVTGKQNVGGIVGDSSSGTIDKCTNTAMISGESGIGGIAGASLDDVDNCWNTGDVDGKNENVGGIVGSSYGLIDADITNCYNTGSISGSGTLGGIVGLYSSPNVTVDNSYYLNTCGAEGLGTAKTEESFSSGEVAYLLQKGQSSQIWGQKVGSGTPELTDEASKTVYQITGEIEGRASFVWYSNNKATVAAAPKKAGYTFAGWSTKKGGSVNFSAGVAVSEDVTVYAIYKRNESVTGGEPSDDEPGDTPPAGGDSDRSQTSGSEESTGSQDPSGSGSDDTIQTGDESPIGLWLTLMVISLIGVVMILVQFTVKRRIADDKSGHRDR